jgi:hypothetical protein
MLTICIILRQSPIHRAFISKIQSGRESLCNFGSRSKVASTQIFHVTHLCPLIHPHTKYQPKIFSHLGIIERKGNIMQFGVKVKGHIDTNLLRDTPLSSDTFSHQISTKNLHSLEIQRGGNFCFKVTGSRSKNHGDLFLQRITEIFSL